VRHGEPQGRDDEGTEEAVGEDERLGAGLEDGLGEKVAVGGEDGVA
jgi:hypothetical protein